MALPGGHPSVRHGAGRLEKAAAPGGGAEDKGAFGTKRWESSLGAGEQGGAGGRPKARGRATPPSPPSGARAARERRAGGARGGAPGPGLLPHGAAGPRVVLGVVSEGAAAPRPLPLRVRGERLDGRPLGLGLPAAGGQGGQRAAGGREHGLCGAGPPAGRGDPGRAQGGQPRLGLRLRGPPPRPGRPATTIERGRPRRPRVPPGPPVFGGRQAARLAEWAGPPEPGPLSPSAPPQRRPGPLGHRGCRGRPGAPHGQGSRPLGLPRPSPALALALTLTLTPSRELCVAPSGSLAPVRIKPGAWACSALDRASRMHLHGYMYSSSCAYSTNT